MVLYSRIYIIELARSADVILSRLSEDEVVQKDRYVVCYPRLIPLGGQDPTL